jgi:hypothetical protein
VLSKNNLVTGKYKKPLIVSQGFDPEFGSSKQFNYNQFITMLTSQDGGTANSSFLRDYYNQGYEIVLVLYKNPGASIEKQSYAFQGVMKHIHEHSEHNKVPLALIGPSMGGLIVRHAVSTYRDRFGFIDGRGARRSIMVPPLSHFIAFDSPNRGAVIPMNVQNFIDYFSGLNQSAKTLHSNLNSPAAKQMLVTHITQPYKEGTKKTQQNTFLFENAKTLQGGFLARLNHPDMLRKLDLHNTYSTDPTLKLHKVAIANGSGSARGHNLTMFSEYAHGEGRRLGTWFVQVKMSSAPNSIFFADYDKLGLGRTAYTHTTHEPFAIENAPGGFRNSYSQVKTQFENSTAGGLSYNWRTWHSNFVNHSFIPTMSALGFLAEKNTFWGANNHTAWNSQFSTLLNRTNESIFDVLYAPSVNEVHVQLTKQNIQWIKQELSKTIR